jgi:hypothetical protein
MKNRLFREQIFPILLTILTFFGLCGLLYLAIVGLNMLPSQEKILLEIRKRDVLVGLTIYLKTSVDFAIFIGNLMRSNPGWKSRVAIEIGTAGGNALGTIAILLIWNFFREVPLLMAIMIFLASLVLLKMAEESFEELEHADKNVPGFLRNQLKNIQKLLRIPNKTFSPILRFVSPGASLTNMKALPWKKLLLFSATIPFILGLDDFAGYIPLFNIINVFGFAIGVFLGHMILNVALFISPNRTVVLVRNPWVLVIGGLAFVLIAGWGFYEVFHLLNGLLFSH